MYLMYNSLSDSMNGAKPLCHSDGNCGSAYVPMPMGSVPMPDDEPRNETRGERHEGREKERLGCGKRHEAKARDDDCRADPAFLEYHGQQFNWNREATTFEPNGLHDHDGWQRWRAAEDTASFGDGWRAATVERRSAQQINDRIGRSERIVEPRAAQHAQRMLALERRLQELEQAQAQQIDERIVETEAARHAKQMLAIERKLQTLECVPSDAAGRRSELGRHDPAEMLALEKRLQTLEQELLKRELGASQPTTAHTASTLLAPTDWSALKQARTTLHKLTQTRHGEHERELKEVIRVQLDEQSLRLRVAVQRAETLQQELVQDTKKFEQLGSLYTALQMKQAAEDEKLRKAKERAELLEQEHRRWEGHVRRCRLRAEWRRCRLRAEWQRQRDWQGNRWQDRSAAQGGARTNPGGARAEWRVQREHRWQAGWQDSSAAQEEA